MFIKTRNSPRNAHVLCIRWGHEEAVASGDFFVATRNLQGQPSFARISGRVKVILHRSNNYVFLWPLTDEFETSNLVKKNISNLPVQFCQIFAD